MCIQVFSLGLGKELGRELIDFFMEGRIAKLLLELGDVCQEQLEQL